MGRLCPVGAAAAAGNDVAQIYGGQRDDDLVSDRELLLDYQLCDVSILLAWRDSTVGDRVYSSDTSELGFPLVVRQHGDFAPLLIIFALFTGSWIDGVIGALVAIPLVRAVLVLVVRVGIANSGTDGRHGVNQVPIHGSRQALPGARRASTGS
ncbi:MAG TPA: hypothetical protein VF898_09550 [Chloroflexota bacterium]